MWPKSNDYQNISAGGTKVPNPLDYTTAGLIAKGAASGFQMFQGIMMDRKGKKLEKSLVRPTRETSQHFKDNLAQAEFMAKDGLSDAEENLYLTESQAIEANQIANARSRKGGLLASETAAERRRKENMQLLAMNAKARQDNMLKVMNARTVLGNEDNMNFLYNEANPYTENLNYARTLRARGREAIGDAINSLASSALAYGAGNAAD